MIKNSITCQYLEESCWDRENLKKLKKFSTDQKQPKSYPANKQIPLSFKWDLDEARLKLLVQNRRSIRKYSSEIMKLEDISFLLWASQGVTAKAGKHFFRSVPSAGALYPYETYIVLKGIEDVQDGIYHFNVDSFSLEQLEVGDYSKQLSNASLNQKFMIEAPVTFLWTGVLSRCMGKYGERALRYILIELGHVCQNILLGAEALGCGGCPVAAFFDDEINELLNVDGKDELVLYAASAGRKPIRKNRS